MMIALACWIGLACSPSTTGMHEPAARVDRFTEHLIAKIPEQSAVYDVTNAATNVREHHCAWSSDGTRVAWIASVQGVPHTALNDQVGNAYLDLQPPIFADNGAHYAFRGKPNDGSSMWVVELDGEEVARAPFIGPLAFSPSSDGLGFWEVEDDEGQLVRLDTTSKARWKKGRGVSLIDMEAGLPHFSADGKRMIASAKGVEEHALVLATKSSVKTVVTAKEWISAPQLSPDGREYGYVAYDTNSEWPRSFAVRGKKRLGASMDQAGFGRFSPDGDHYAYTVRKGSLSGLAIDKDSSAATKYYAVIEITWDASGQRVAFVASNDGPSMVAATGEEYEESGGKWFVVNRLTGSKDGVEGPGYVQVANLVFSPSGDHLAYQARRGMRWMIVVDGQESAIYDEVGLPVFSSDGKHVAFGARKGRELWWKVLEVESLMR